jgi:hypothetical protein
MEEPNVRIVRFEGGELTLEEARSGAYIFAAGPEPETRETETIYAFEKRPTDKAKALEELSSWADERNLKDALLEGRAKLDQVPDATPELAEVERVRKALSDLAEETGMAPGPELIDTARERGIFGTLLLFRQGAFNWPPFLPLILSCPNLPSLGWSETRSGHNWSYDIVQLYEEINYGPDRDLPLYTLLAKRDMRYIPHPPQIRSALFV